MDEETLISLLAEGEVLAIVFWMDVGACLI
jgi:hypothetical protein